ncbi:MAG: radical SAM protein [Candidatus Gracilibacteria bacterium]|nr:radical SAM protein [Candidatus Gracilibacteria bacterium]
MNYKRLEIYTGWTCNQKCTYCMEYPNMQQAWNKKVTKYDILKKLIKYKKDGYNHVTYLGGEPFIHDVFLDSLKIGKKLGYKILVTTNCTTLHIDNQASKFLPFIDELFLSVEAISVEDQQKISRTKNYVNWEGVFKNIKKYWKGTLLKANIVITQDNKNKLFNLVEFLEANGIKNIAITYPDIAYKYYGKKYVLENISPTYTECITEIEKLVKFGEEKEMIIKVVDFPFCVFPKDKIERYIKLTDDYDYQTRLKITHKEDLLDRGETSPRMRKNGKKCKDCKYKKICWGPSIHYEKLYGLDEINCIKN